MSAVEQIVGHHCDAGGCPRLDSRELLDISEAANCENYWFYENSFSTRRTTDKEKFEMRDLGADGKVPPTLFSIPCKPGEPLDVTRGGTVATVDFANYKTFVTIDPCEVLEEVYFPDDCDPYDRLPYEEKYRRHVAAKTALLRKSVETRYEIMATMMKMHGSYIISGPKMDPVLLDFQRNPCLSVAMKQPWNCGVDTFPLEDIEYFKHLVKVATGGKVARRFHWGVDAWHAAYSHHQVRKEVISACECSEPGNNIVQATDSDCGIEFVGNLRGVPCYVDSRTYIDHEGQEQYFVPVDALMIETEGMGGFRAHGKIMSPSAGFEPGDLFFRQTFDEETEFWRLQVEGSILIMPMQVNTCMLIRNLSKVMTYPGNQCRDLLIDSEGEVYAPPVHGSEDVDRLDEIARSVADNDWFEVCSMIVGRTPPRVACADLDRCIPGDPCRIVPTTNGCPDAMQRVISKASLIEQGVDARGMCDLVRHYALRPIALPSEDQLCAPMLIETPASLNKVA